MFADLHTHSIYTDGKHTPDELCQRAVSAGVSLFSVTDHDTLAGEEEKRAAAKRHGLLYVTGWEISAYYGNEKTHILGYGCQLCDAYFRFMEESKNAALLRAEDNVKKLRKLGLAITMEQVLAERSAPDLPVHAMHVSRAVGKVLSIKDTEAYTRYLGYGREGYSSVGRTPPKQAIDCIHECGGRAIIAHPGRLFTTGAEREETLRFLVNCGVDGIEVFYTTHTTEETAYFLAFARAHNLLVTGGSDFHFDEETHRVGYPRFLPDEKLLACLLEGGR